jgi:hypothetical protein
MFILSEQEQGQCLDTPNNCCQHIAFIAFQLHGPTNHRKVGLTLLARECINADTCHTFATIAAPQRCKCKIAGKSGAVPGLAGTPGNPYLNKNLPLGINAFFCPR